MLKPQLLQIIAFFISSADAVSSSGFADHVLPPSFDMYKEGSPARRGAPTASASLPAKAPNDLFSIMVRGSSRGIVAHALLSLLTKRNWSDILLSLLTNTTSHEPTGKSVNASSSFGVNPWQSGQTLMLKYSRSGRVPNAWVGTMVGRRASIVVFFIIVGRGVLRV